MVSVEAYSNIATVVYRCSIYLTKLSTQGEGFVLTVVWMSQNSQFAESQELLNSITRSYGSVIITTFEIGVSRLPLSRRKCTIS